MEFLEGLDAESMVKRGAINPDDDSQGAPRTFERTSDALARCMLETVLTARLRRLFKSPSRLIVIRTEDEEAARLLDRYLRGLERAPVIEAHTEPQKSGGRLVPQGRTELAALERGRSVILISQDPERVLVPEALAAADAVITIPHPGLAVIRKTIRLTTGEIVRGLLPSDVEGLGLLDLISERTSALQKSLGASDKVLLDGYLETVREIERRVEIASERDLSHLDLPTAPVGERASNYR